MNTSYADLEISLHGRAAAGIVADVRFRSPASNADADLALAVPVVFRWDELRAHRLDLVAYSTLLTQQLFSHRIIRDAWLKVKGYIEATDGALRVRLRIDRDTAELHALNWEALCDPETNAPLSRSARILLTRYLDTGDLTRVPTLGRDDLRALAILASPDDLGRYGLPGLDTAAELQRIRRALNGTPLEVIGRGHGKGAATFGAVLNALSSGYPLVYLCCHGTLVDGDSYLWLERDDGSCDRISGIAFAERIAALPADCRPLLVMLAACQSAQVESDGVLGALAPRLARAGVSAVIGMQGNVPVDTVEQLMPRFFSLLTSDGAIDRALALARAELPDSQPWWMPVLYLRARDGRLWRSEEPATAPRLNAGPAIETGLIALTRLAQQNLVRSALSVFRADFEAATDRVAEVTSQKTLHDLFHQLEDARNVIAGAMRRVDLDLNAWDDLDAAELDLRRLVERIIEATRSRVVDVPLPLWARRLQRAAERLSGAVAQSQASGVREALGAIDVVLGTEPARANVSLVSAARSLRLLPLAESLSLVHRQLTAEDNAAIHEQALSAFGAAVAALNQIAIRLSELVQLHDLFQELDSELRRARTIIDGFIEDLHGTWEDIVPLIGRLVGAKASWVEALRGGGDALADALQHGDEARIRRSFSRLRALVVQSFNQVDYDLLTLCQELRSVGQPLRLLVSIL